MYGILQAHRAEAKVKADQRLNNTYVQSDSAQYVEADGFGPVLVGSGPFGSLDRDFSRPAFRFGGHSHDFQCSGA